VALGADTLLGVFSVSSVADSLAFFLGRVTNNISLLFHSVSLSFASFFYSSALSFSSIFFFAVARSERKGHGSYGEEQYFFHGERRKVCFEIPSLNASP
jgi:hypothetical protein